MEGERLNHGIEHGDTGNAQGPAAILENGAHGVVDDGEEDHPGLGVDGRENLLELTLGPDHRPQVLDPFHPLELDEAGTRDVTEGLTGRVGDEMEMKLVNRHVLGQMNSGDKDDIIHSRRHPPQLSRNNPPFDQQWDKTYHGPEKRV